MKNLNCSKFNYIFVVGACKLCIECVHGVTVEMAFLNGYLGFFVESAVNSNAIICNIGHVNRIGDVELAFNNIQNLW